MSQTRKLVAILVSDVVGYFAACRGGRGRNPCAPSRSALATSSTRLSPLITTRTVRRTATAGIIEFRCVVDAVRCLIEVQQGLIERNAGVPPDRRIEFRVGIHLGDVVEESDGDLMGDGVNIAARLEGIAKPGAICLSEDAYRQVKGRLEMSVSDLGQTQLKNIAEPVRVYSVEVGKPARRPRPRRSRREELVPALVALAAVLVVAAAVAPWNFVASKPWETAATSSCARRCPPPSGRAVAVLPFANATGATPRTTCSRCASARKRRTISANTAGCAPSKPGGAAKSVADPRSRHLPGARR